MCFRDLGHKDADAERFKAILAAEIIKALDRERPSVRRGARAHRDCRSRPSRASAMQTWEGSPSIGLCPSSTGSARGWRLKSGSARRNSEAKANGLGSAIGSVNSRAAEGGF